MNTAERRQKILDQIAAAAKVARREPADVSLIAVSKTRALQEIEKLIASGQRDFGESRVQEAMEKWPALLARHAGTRLHCIGRLQSNKAPEAVKLFEKASKSDDAEVAAWAQKTLPTLQHHLMMAKDLKKTL